MNSLELEKATTSSHQIFGDCTDVPEQGLSLISVLEIPRQEFWGTLLLGYRAWDRELFSEQGGSGASSQHSMSRVGDLGFPLPGILDHVQNPSHYPETGTISKQARKGGQGLARHHLTSLLFVRYTQVRDCRTFLSPFPFLFS